MAFQRVDAIIRKIEMMSSVAFHRKAIERVVDVCRDLALEAMREHKNARDRPWALIKATKTPANRLGSLAAASLRESIANMLARFSVNFSHAKAHNLGAKRGATDSRTGAKHTNKSFRSLSKADYAALKPHLVREHWRLPARSFLPKGGRLPPKWSAAINAEMRELFGAIWGT